MTWALVGFFLGFFSVAFLAGAAASLYLRNQAHQQGLSARGAQQQRWREDERMYRLYAQVMTVLSGVFLSALGVVLLVA